MDIKSKNGCYCQHESCIHQKDGFCTLKQLKIIGTAVCSNYKQNKDYIKS